VAVSAPVCPSRAATRPGPRPDAWAQLGAKFVRRVIAAELSRRVVASDTGTTVLPGLPEAGEVIRTAEGASWITSPYWTLSSAIMSEALAGAATAEQGRGTS
jgi:hypothetical protein